MCIATLALATIFAVTCGPRKPLQEDFASVLLYCHVILLSEAPSQLRVAEVAAQNTVQPAM